MDFFSAQDEARKNTKWLVLLFSLAVVSIILLLYLALIFFGSYSNTASMAQPVRWWQPELFLIIAGLTSAVILLGSLFKTLSLARGGGAAVAVSLDGRLVSRATGDPLEQRLLNVVDEMAIASGMPVPMVYLLDEENSINAFAAGADVHHAVIAVTRGCLEQLGRDELQGVVAHEFSHIFNGDMRINLRLIGILHGILLLALAGRMILRGGGHRRSRNAGGIVVVGLVLLVVGYAGLFFGRVIKAAISRQREFLADAAAVQFTRNPSGLAGALKKIGGYTDRRIAHPKAEEASHMFFDTGVAMHFNLLATHPPLEQRIKRLEPMFSAASLTVSVTEQTIGGEAVMGLAGGEAVRGSPDRVRWSVGNSDERHLDYAHELLAALPPKIVMDVHDPQRVRAVVYALLAGSLADPAAQLPTLLQEESKATIDMTISHLSALSVKNRAARLPLIELAIPAISEADGDHTSMLMHNCRVLVEADKRVTMFEFAVLSLLEHALVGEKRPNVPRRMSLGEIGKDCQVLFSLLAHAGHREADPARSAFRRAWERVRLEGPVELLECGQIPMEGFTKSLARLNTLKFAFKAKLIEAAVAAIGDDGKVTLNEAELLRAIGARLDCPIPPILPGSLA